MITYKKLFAALVLMLCFSGFPCCAKDPALSVHLLDKCSAEKEVIVSMLLELQSAWQIDIRNPPSEDKTQDGFLFVRMTPQAVFSLIDDHNAPGPHKGTG